MGVGDGDPDAESGGLCEGDVDADVDGADDALGLFDGATDVAGPVGGVGPPGAVATEELWWGGGRCEGVAPDAPVSVAVAVPCWPLVGVAVDDVSAGRLARDAAAADAEFWLTWADTPAWESRRGVLLETWLPTRSTAVKVTAVTSAHDISQPIASVSGRLDHPRLAPRPDVDLGHAKKRRRRL